MKSNLTLLCVEDDKEALEDIIYLLKRYFKEVYSACDGEEALMIYEEKKPDIVLLDINIPKIDGLKVASIIREKNKILPIIFISAYSEKEKLLKAIEVQAYSYIIKPFQVSELKKTILKAINNITHSCIALSGDFTWQQSTQELFYKNNSILLTKNETRLILFLLEHRTKYFTKYEIMEELYNSEKDNSDHNLVQLISRLKKKIHTQTKKDYFFIENRYGSGYRIL